MINGRITDHDTKLPVAGVSITVTPGNLSAKTDGHGYYRIQSLCEGNYTLTFKSLGFTDIAKQIVLQKSTTLNIEMEHGDILLHDVEVIGHAPIAKSTAKVATLEAEQLEQSRGSTLAQALSKIAGVSMLTTGSTIAKPVINGMHSNRVLILNNGVRLEGQQWGTEHAPEIDPYVAKTLSVIKGAEGVRYGADALGGIILATPAPLPIDRPISGELNLVGASNGQMGNFSGMLEGNIKSLKGLAWRAQGSYKKAGNIKSPDYFINNTGVTESNFSAALGYNASWGKIDAYFSHFNTEIGIYQGSHIGTASDIYERIQVGRPIDDGSFTYTIENPRQKIIHDLAKLKLHKDFDNGASLDIQYAFQKNHRREYDIRLFESPTTPSLDLTLTTQTLDVSYDHLKKNHWRTIIGANGIMQVNNNKPGTGTTPLIPNYDSYTLGVYGIERYIGNNYELEAGVRYDYKYFDAAGYRYDYQHPNPDGSLNHVLYTGNRNFNNVSGSLGAVWHINNQLSLRSNAGLAWRAPAANELFSDGVHHGAALYEIGDPDLKSEQGYKWVNSATYSSDKWHLNLDVYAQFVNNYIYATPDPDSVRQTIRGTFPVFIYEQKDARFWGIDFDGSYKILKALTYNMNVAIVRAKNSTDNIYLPYIPADRLEHNLRWDINLHNGSNWNAPYLQVGHRFVARQTRYEPNSDYAAPPPSYNLINLMAGVKYKLGGQTFSFHASVDNLTNKLYKDYMNRFRYYTHEMGRNITLRLQYNF
ncbi:TonB-dependent receptor [Olivibacter sp. SDN3]|uniref:TonB-dependent receptor n=1 Tax=Olivibacter sp. SDN3 TaxID=2764720 RepID=UPI00165186DC|nr:TonB-dependent receptor [Olivibacter sp. SDN3]QNL47808.1 TonB-dependent receptor [Olivibacter sp. SDN3]